MKLACLFVLIGFSSAFGQFPVGEFYSIYPAKVAVVSFDSTTIKLLGGNPVFNQETKTVGIDSAEEGNTVTITRISERSPSSWRIIGKLKDTTSSTYAILDVDRISPTSFQLAFLKNEYQTQTDAEAHLKDSAVSFGFQFIGKDRVAEIMSLKSVEGITAQDLTAVIRATTHAVNARMKQYENQPDLAMFAMMILPMQITIDEFVAKGYNPFVAQQTMEAMLNKLKEDPEVKKAIEESSQR